MSLSHADRRHHRIYEALPHSYRLAIDDAYVSTSRVFITCWDKLNLQVKGDDRAEAYIAAITRFIVESNPEDAAIKAAIEEVDAS